MTQEQVHAYEAHKEVVDCTYVEERKKKGKDEKTTFFQVVMESYLYGSHFDD
jgi:hypothetical protein